MVRSFLETIGISHIPKSKELLSPILKSKELLRFAYGNSVAMATRVKPE